MNVEGATSQTSLTAFQTVRFLWWNVQDFLHYVPSKARLDKWPKSRAQYLAKSAKVASVLKACIAKYGTLDIIALGEITREAASELRDQVFPNHKLHSLDNVDGNPEAHVAILYPSTVEYDEAGLFAATSVPPGTRPMAILDIVSGGQRVRFIAVHWTAPFDENSDLYREGLARQLRGHIYDFVDESPMPGTRHVVIIGDLNAEPFEKVLRRDFVSTRSHVRARSQSHPTDKSVKRLHLYNCAWRLLGERDPHERGVPASGIAGTFYWKKKNTWHTLDHVIVSGSLLADRLPSLLESSIDVFANNELVDENGHPSKFSWSGGTSKGLSDHLPVVGSLLIEPEKIL